MIEVIDRLYLGNREHARDLPRLQAAGVTHVVNCTIELPNYHDGQLAYLKLGLFDPDSRFLERIGSACRFIHQAREGGGTVLVHCLAAVSRSPSTVLAYLCHLGHPLRDAAGLLGRVAWTDPAQVFLRQLAEHLGTGLDEDGVRDLWALLQTRVRAPLP